MVATAKPVLLLILIMMNLTIADVHRRSQEVEAVL